MEMDLFKAVRPHKYIKREKGPDGKWIYWYKMPDGSVKSSEEDEGKHAGSKLEHVQRLVAARAHGHHSMSSAEMASHVGDMSATEVDRVRGNLAKRGRKKLKRDGETDDYVRAVSRSDAAKHGHGFSDDELHESYKETDSPEYAAKVERMGSAASKKKTSKKVTKKKVTKKKTSRRPALRDTSGPGDETTPSRMGETVEASLAPAEETLRSNGFEMSGTGRMAQRSMGEYTAMLSVSGEKIRLEISKEDASLPEGRTLVSTEFGLISEAIREANNELNSRASESMSPVSKKKTKKTAKKAVKKTVKKVSKKAANKEKINALREKLKAEHSLELPGGEPAPEPIPLAGMPDSNPPTEPRILERRNAEATSHVESHDLGEADPEFAEADAPVMAMVQEQAHGGNPYLSRAKNIFDRIKDDIKPERKQVVEHMMSAIEQLHADGSMSEANLLAKYKEVSGRSRVRGLSGVGADFEKGTFISLEEIMSNAPVDVEKERMVRGYAAKQFMRIKPFLKSGWQEAHPSAPPPMPTFGDIRNWNAGEKPEWAGTTRLALPQEVNAAAVRTPDGKPLYPPAWMPIHLMPVWNYVAKKTVGTDNNPYASRRVDVEQLGPKASFQEGIITNALRKYVKYRGESNLVDIPKSKLSEVGMTHHDIFKSEEAKGLLTNKIIDNVSLMPFIRKEIQKSMKKSFSLYIDSDAPSFKKSEKIDERELKKSMIERIKDLRCKKKKSFFVKSATRR